MADEKPLDISGHYAVPEGLVRPAKSEKSLAPNRKDRYKDLEARPSPQNPSPGDEKVPKEDTNFVGEATKTSK